MASASLRLRAHPWGAALAISVVLLVANIAVRPSFGTLSSWPATLAAFSPFALAAIASTPQILSGGGGIDISIGPLLNFVGIVVVAVLVPHSLGSAALAIPLALLLGLSIGLINGLLVAALRFQPVLATLCTLFVLQGAGTKLLGQPRSVSLPWLSGLAGNVGPVPGALVILAAVALIWMGLRRLPYSEALYCTGSDDAASFSAGINVTAVRVAAYGLGGLFAGFAGISLLAVTQSADPSQSLQYTLPALAAVAVGGTSLRGGRGSLGGSVAGAAIMFLIQTLLDSLAVSDLWLQLVYGALLLTAIIANSAIAMATP